MTLYTPDYRFPFDLSVVLAAAEAGEAYAQWRLGNCYGTGEAVALDLCEAARWYRAAAAQGLPVAQRALGFLYGGGQLGKPDLEASLDWYLAAAKGGLPKAQWEAGQRLLYGIGAPVDEGRAALLLEGAAANGDLQALVQLWHLRVTGGPLPDSMGSAARRVGCLANTGDAEASYLEGLFYLTYDGSSKKALNCLHRAAGAGSGAAQVHVAKLLMAQSASFEATEAVQAHQWMTCAAKGGNGEAMCLIGEWFSEGRGGPVDPHRAEAWFERGFDSDFIGAGSYFGAFLMLHSGASATDCQLAADLLVDARDKGFMDARHHLGFLALHFPEAVADPSTLEAWMADGVLFGTGQTLAVLGKRLLASDPVRALFWLQAGAEEDDPWAQTELAEAYLAGVGGKDRTSAAVALFGCAAYLGDATAAAKLAFHFNFNKNLIRNHYYAGQVNEYGARKGDPMAQHNLSLQLRAGEGVEPNQVAADYWADKQGVAVVEGLYSEPGGTCIRPQTGEGLGKSEGKVLNIAAYPRRGAGGRQPG